MTPGVTDRRRQPRARASPHVERLDGDTAGQMTAMEWARYLAATFGTEGALDALRYYESVGWISASVRRTMVDHVRGLPLDDLEQAGDDGDPAADLDESVATLADSPFARHAKSLEYVAAIAGDSLAGDLQAIRLPETAGVPQAGNVAPDESFDAPTADAPGPDADASNPGDADAADGERVGVATALDDADTYHLLAVGGARSLCGVLDADTPSAADVAEVLARDAAEDAGLELCGHCRQADE